MDALVGHVTDACRVKTASASPFGSLEPHESWPSRTTVMICPRRFAGIFR